MSSETVWHVSETPGIGHFAPRPPPSLDANVAEAVVWAVNDLRLPNYLLPRECPRVAFHVAAHTTARDIEQFFTPGGSQYVIAVERAWLARIAQCVLHCYAMPATQFVCVDANAGYFVSREAVRPTRVERIDDVAVALKFRGVELRVEDRLHSLAHAVSSSSLGFSCIRMRNALA